MVFNQKFMSHKCESKEIDVFSFIEVGGSLCVPTSLIPMNILIILQHCVVEWEEMKLE